MKAEKGSEIITTICEYENSVAMPDNERLTYLDTCGIARLKDGNGNVKAQEAYASRCSEYLRFGHEVDLAACGAYSPYDALKVCDTPEIFLKTGFEQRPMLYTQKHLFQALTPKSDYNPHRHGFSIEQVKRFPELLASPVVLANSPTREDVLLAILLATDAYDTPLIAGMKPADRKELVGSEDFALFCWDSVNHLPAIRRISLKASLTSRLIDFKYLREAEPAAEAPAGTRWVPSDAPDYGFDDNDDDIPAFSFPEA